MFGSLKTANSKEPKTPPKTTKPFYPSNRSSPASCSASPLPFSLKTRVPCASRSAARTSSGRATGAPRTGPSSMETASASPAATTTVPVNRAGSPKRSKTSSPHSRSRNRHRQLSNHLKAMKYLLPALLSTRRPPARTRAVARSSETPSSKSQSSQSPRQRPRTRPKIPCIIFKPIY